MKKFLYSLPLLPAAVLTAVCACAQQNPLLKNEKKIDGIIAGMSLEEKVAMLHAKTNMSSEGIPRLNIQEIRYTDGPFGIREENGDGFRPLGWTTDTATYFPTGSALAATWSPELSYKYGDAMGKEARLRGKDIVLGPAINIQRLPVGGRTYEYFSEDPFLNSKLAVAYVKGMQDAGTAACVKHFALNNQETNRGSVNVIIDERTMREMYLKPFEATVREANAWCIMPAYNKINGKACSENDELCNKILRDEWGFKGMTVSDWGGTYSTVGAALGGLDVQMPGSNFFGDALLEAVRKGDVPESVIDDKVRDILRLRFTVRAVPDDEANKETASRPESRATAYEVASKSIVLLKNNNSVLPLDASKLKKVAVIGRMATEKTANGGMGAGVKAPYEITPLQGLKDVLPSSVDVVYAPGYKDYKGMFGRADGSNDIAADVNEPADPKLMAEAVSAAKDADIVLFFAGDNKSVESEGIDRKSIMLPVGQDEVIEAVAAVNPNIVTVVISGGPVDLNQVDRFSGAIVEGWWNGLETGHALADVLTGKISPSGKLPFTFPVKLEDSPAYAMGNFPQAQVGGDVFGAQFRKDIKGQKSLSESKGPEAQYSEKMLVGYRWYDTKDVTPMYAFGHGLSYVPFKYTFDKISSDVSANGTIKVSLSVQNMGKQAADEVVQLYIRRPESTVEWPEKELKAFERVSLNAGETKRICLEVPVSELRYWNIQKHGWDLEKGLLDVMVGSSSRDIRIRKQVKVK